MNKSKHCDHPGSYCDYPSICKTRGCVMVPPRADTVEVLLLSRAGAEVALLNVEASKIAEAASVLYGTRHYVYQGLEPFGSRTTIRFREVNPPVDLTP